MVTLSRQSARLRTGLQGFKPCNEGESIINKDSRQSSMKNKHDFSTPSSRDSNMEAPAPSMLQQLFIDKA